MQPPDRKIWFPAKRYGWGWGLPCCWQGWVVMGCYIVFGVIGAFLITPSNGFLLFGGYLGMLSLLLIAICWLKGEQPRWRWGKDT